MTRGYHDGNAAWPQVYYIFCVVGFDGYEEEQTMGSLPRYPSHNRFIRAIIQVQTILQEMYRKNVGLRSSWWYAQFFTVQHAYNNPSNGAT